MFWLKIFKDAFLFNPCMFWLKIFKDAFLFNPWVDYYDICTVVTPWMNLFDICTVVRYWSKVLWSTISALLSDLDTKVMALENFLLFFFRIGCFG